VLFISVVLVNLLIMDGKGNYMEGLMLIILYFIIALACESSFLPHLSYFSKLTTTSLSLSVWVS